MEDPKLVEARKRIILALDVKSIGEAASLVHALSPHVGMFKVGPEFFFRAFGQMFRGDTNKRVDAFMAVQQLFLALSGKLMCDYKFFDIQFTMVQSALAVVEEFDPKILTIHATAGVRRMRAVVEKVGADKVVAVTILTDTELKECYRTYGDNISAKIITFVEDAIQAGVQNIVCAPGDIRRIREHRRCPAGFEGLWKITPNIRSPLLPGEAPSDDQNPDRALTPAEAIIVGADQLVIGRPITQPKGETSVEAAMRIVAEVAAALAECRNL